MEKEQAYKDAAKNYENAWKNGNRNNPTIGECQYSYQSHFSLFPLLLHPWRLSLPFPHVLPLPPFISHPVILPFPLDLPIPPFRFLIFPFPLPFPSFPVFLSHSHSLPIFLLSSTSICHNYVSCVAIFLFAGFRLAFNYLKAKRYVDAIDVCHLVSTFDRLHR